MGILTVKTSHVCFYAKILFTAKTIPLFRQNWSRIWQCGHELCSKLHPTIGPCMAGSDDPNPSIVDTGLPSQLIWSTANLSILVIPVFVFFFIFSGSF